MSEKKGTLQLLPVTRPGGLVPLNASAASSPTVPPSLSIADAAEQWLAENPTFDASLDFPAPAASGEPTDAPLADAPADGSAQNADPSKGTSPDAPPAAVVANVAATPEAAPAAQGAPSAAAAAATSAAPAPAPSYDPTEQLHLVSGQEPWTREQVVSALRGRAEDVPLVEDAKAFRALFGADAKTAQAQWTPILERLRSDPTLTTFIDSILGSDVEKVGYLVRSAEFYDASAERAPAAAAAPAPTPDPRVTELERYVEAQRKHASQERVNREWATATGRYPFLATDPLAREGLIRLANQLYQEDLSKGISDLEARGIPDALAINGALYDARAIAIQASAAAPAPAAAAATPVPAMLGAAGASPNGPRRHPPARPPSSMISMTLWPIGSTINHPSFRREVIYRATDPIR